jgi:hypothetical protein
MARTSAGSRNASTYARPHLWAERPRRRAQPPSASLEAVTDQPHGLDRGRTNSGGADFPFYLRRSFGKPIGYSRAMLARP